MYKVPSWASVHELLGRTSEKLGENLTPIWQEPGSDRKDLPKATQWGNGLVSWLFQGTLVTYINSRSWVGLVEALQPGLYLS